MKTERSQLTKKIVFWALFIALVYLCTAFVNIRLPIAANGGLVHLGNVPLFIIALVFGKKYGALAGGVGMALFDITGGWLLWAPFTLAVVAYVVGAVTEKRKGLAAAIPALALACAIKILGYYIAEGIIYGNWIAPLASVPGNLVQIGVAVLIVLPLISRIRFAARKIAI
jgi:uncharacterized membrane protein